MNVDEFANVNQGPLLKALIALNGNCKTIVEIGTLIGSSLKWILEGAELVGGHVYAFDCYKEPHPNSNLQYVHQRMIDFGFSKDLFTLIEVDTMSNEFKEILNKLCPSIDLAFIDGDHSYSGVKSDFLNIYPLLNNHHGSILFHDTGYFSGPREFITELRTELYDGTFDIIEFPWNNNSETNSMSLLVKRPLKSKDIKILSACSSSPEQIYAKELDFYNNEIQKYKKS